MKKKKNILMRNARDTVGLGMGSMVGLGAMGAIGGMPGMPVNTIIPTASAGLGLLNVGQMAKNGLGIMDIMGNRKSRNRYGKKK